VRSAASSLLVSCASVFGGLGSEESGDRPFPSEGYVLNDRGGCETRIELLGAFDTLHVVKREVGERVAENLVHGW